MREADSGLKRELGLRDITLFAISCMVGTRWIAAAAHAGPGSITLWLLAAVFFVVPLAIAVAALSVRHPKAGGLYVWTRADFGPWHGFLCFWVFWMGIAFWFPSATMFYMSVALRGLGLPDTRTYVLAASLIALWVALGTNLVGLKIGKWTQNVGAISTWLVCALLVALAALVWSRRGTATVLNVVPVWSWNTVIAWASVAYGMTGLEMAGLMGGDVRDPERTFPRAGWIASACGVAFYSAATIALLVLLPESNISEMNGLADAGHEAARVLHLAWVGPLVVALVIGSAVGQFGGIGTSASQLPFAAAVDGLLPAVFSRLHPRWGTPYASMLALGLVATFLLIVIQLGDTMRAAYQALVSLMVITGFLPYIYIFGSSWKSGRRISAVSGWAITALAILCSVVPAADVTNVWLFEAKLALGISAVIASAWVVYFLTQRR